MKDFKISTPPDPTSTKLERSRVVAYLRALAAHVELAAQGNGQPDASTQFYVAGWTHLRQAADDIEGGVLG